MSETMVRASGGFSRANVAAARAEGKNEGIAETKKGTAEANDVLYGKTFTNSSAVNVPGAMPNNMDYDIVLAGRGSEANIPRGYHDGRGVVSVAAPSGVKYLTGSQLGPISLSPYDYSMVDGTALYNAGMVEIAERVKFETEALGAETVNKDAYTAAVSVANPYAYPMTVIVTAIASVTATASGYAVPVINVSDSELWDSYTREHTSTNVKSKIVVGEYKVPAYTTASVSIQATVHGSNITYSITAGRIKKG